MSPRRPGASAHCQSSPKADFWQFAHFFSRPRSPVAVPGTEPAIASKEACSRVNFRRLMPYLLTLAGLIVIYYVSLEYSWMLIELNRLDRELQSQYYPSRAAALAGSSALDCVF